MRNQHLMRIWFRAFNADVQQAREAYDLNRLAETDHETAVLLAKAWAQAEHDEAVAEGLDLADRPKLCRNKLHEMTPENTVNTMRCVACKKSHTKRTDARRAARKADQRRTGRKAA